MPGRQVPLFFGKGIFGLLQVLGAVFGNTVTLDQYRTRGPGGLKVQDDPFSALQLDLEVRAPSALDGFNQVLHIPDTFAVYFTYHFI